MNKSELVDAVASHTGLAKTKAKEVVTAIFENIIPHQVIGKNNKLTLPKFGTLSVKRTKARNGRNPKTGAVVEIAASHKVVYGPGTDYKEQAKSLSRTR